MKEELTIITTTYNREKEIIRLYKSLCNQTDKNFIWLIIDDGSTDNTNQQIQKFQSENKIKIEYLYKDNGGKHSALNFSSDNIKTEYVLIVDSDDFLNQEIEVEE